LNSGLVLIRRCSTAWATSPILFFSGYFGDRVSLFSQAGLDSNPPILCFWLSLGRQAPTTISFFPLTWGLANFFLPRLAWNHDPPDLSLLHSLGWQAHTTLPSYWLRWDLVNFLPKLALNHNPSNLRFPSN
jgi:hypothetical protein